MAKGAAEASDSVTLLQSKLRLVTTGEENLAKVQADLLTLSRQTRTDFESLGDLYARVARSSKQLGASQSDVLRVTRAVTQAIQISGNTSQEASAGMIQLAQALASGTLRGDELRSVLEQMPRVAEAIATGLGTTIGQLRKFGQEGKLTSDLVFKALISQAGVLDSEFKKIKPTIGQSITLLVNELKLATAELLKTTGTTDRLTKSISLLSEAIRGLTTFFGTITELSRKFNIEMEKSDRAILKMLNIDYDQFNANMRGMLATNPVALGLMQLFSDKREIKTRGPTGEQRGRGRKQEDLLPAVSTLEEVNVTVKKIIDENGDLLREWNDNTKTELQKQSQEYIKLRTNLQFLRDEGIIDQKEYEKRIGGALDELLPEINLNEIRAKYDSLKKHTTELGEFMKGVWQQVGRSIQSTISDALYEWRLSWRSLLDIARRALADITAAIITSGIKAALKSAFSSGGSSGGSGGFWTGVLKAIGFAAGGGRSDGPTWVGEDGKELVTGTHKVYNQRQMAFAGGKSSISFAPVMNVSIIERENPDQTKQEILQVVAMQQSKQSEQFAQLMERNGLEFRV